MNIAYFVVVNLHPITKRGFGEILIMFRSGISYCSDADFAKVSEGINLIVSCQCCFY